MSVFTSDRSRRALLPQRATETHGRRDFLSVVLGDWLQQNPRTRGRWLACLVLQANGWSRREIAQALRCTGTDVRKYILRARRSIATAYPDAVSLYGAGAEVGDSSRDEAGAG
jgi:hypothetical protein